MYFPSSSSSPRFLSLDPSLAEGGSGVFFPPPFPFPADFGLSFPPFPLSLPSAAYKYNYILQLHIYVMVCM